MIRKLFPRTSYEKESFLKAFLLFFLLTELLLGVIFFLLFRSEVSSLRYTLFLEMKNYSYTFEGEKFRIDIVPAKGTPRFYELLEDERSLYILVPIPGVETDLLKIYYPREAFREDLEELVEEKFRLFLIASFGALLTSFLFSLYALGPLRRALNLIEEVMKDIIHDMNTPITTLKINLALLKNSRDPKALERMDLALKQLENLKENLSPLLRERALSQEEVNLAAIVKEELENFRLLYPHLRVETELKEVKLRGDPYVIRRVISNVIGNAFKHNVKNGFVRVVLGEEGLLVENTSRPVKHPEKLFERFYRESQRGIGLGLSIVKRFSEALGWRVRVSYEKGVFRLELRFSPEGERRA
ncbi:MAG: HAMP domain-containing histidine kinase [Aquificae bacterium]|nr:HAMP domain-containing histidine kinase [Aquificota bacterium]